mgnify:CR=1 FL=1
MAEVGSLVKTNNFGYLLITRYVSSREVYSKFIDTGYEVKTTMQQLLKGNINDRLKPTVFGVGVIGECLTVDSCGNRLKEYQVWKGMLERCYSDKFQAKKPTYKGCIVSENFKYFPYFKEWCNKQIGFDQVGWHLDKDILSKGNKVYSEDTCCFVPQEINSLLVRSNATRGKYPLGVSYLTRLGMFEASVSLGGRNKRIGRFYNAQEAFYAYKEVKESYIKEVANKWKDRIDPRVYNALMSWNIEITD